MVQDLFDKFWDGKDLFGSSGYRVVTLAFGSRCNELCIQDDIKFWAVSIGSCQGSCFPLTGPFALVANQGHRHITGNDRQVGRPLQRSQSWELLIANWDSVSGLATRQSSPVNMPCSSSLFDRNLSMLGIALRFSCQLRCRHPL